MAERSVWSTSVYAVGHNGNRTSTPTLAKALIPQESPPAGVACFRSCGRDQADVGGATGAVRLGCSELATCLGNLYLVGQASWDLRRTLGAT